MRTGLEVPGCLICGLDDVQACKNEAKELGRRYYNATFELWKATGTIWENLSSMQRDHPKIKSGKDFCGWGALAPICLPQDLGF